MTGKNRSVRERKARIDVASLTHNFRKNSLRAHGTGGEPVDDSVDARFIPRALTPRAPAYLQVKEHLLLRPPTIADLTIRENATVRGFPRIPRLHRELGIIHHYFLASRNNPAQRPPITRALTIAAGDFPYGNTIGLALVLPTPVLLPLMSRSSLSAVHHPLFLFLPSWQALLSRVY